MCMLEVITKPRKTLGRLAKGADVKKAMLVAAAASFATAVLNPVNLVSPSGQGIVASLSPGLFIGAVALVFYIALGHALWFVGRWFRGKAKKDSLLTGVYYALTAANIISFVAMLPGSYLMATSTATGDAIPAFFWPVMLAGLVSMAAFAGYTAIALSEINKQRAFDIVKTMIVSAGVMWVVFLAAGVVVGRALIGSW